MSEVWSWHFADRRGARFEGEDLPTSTFPTQAEAEGWLGESWPDLLAAGVGAVTLRRDGDEVYGPMSLEPPDGSDASGAAGGAW